MKTNRVDELANRLAKQGQTDRIESALNEFDPSGASEEERESWYHSLGITAFQRGDRQEARRRFREARGHFPEFRCDCLLTGTGRGICRRDRPGLRAACGWMQTIIAG